MTLQALSDLTAADPLNVGYIANFLTLQPLLSSAKIAIEAAME
eukprot:CAMPEP_0170079450 /NCGR_PEP_ID=MMETSP0019_2-20121128/15820_1 /TAXON_ID=98059 /ORGANISM="Dinobryon sp., Strain UTEXLB2267" /LENGTH=42 /DNA_ID= /DNA_START= /DNA_END= /DNA_ORIENTATION=